MASDDKRVVAPCHPPAPLCISLSLLHCHLWVAAPLCPAAPIILLLTCAITFMSCCPSHIIILLLILAPSNLLTCAIALMSCCSNCCWPSAPSALSPYAPSALLSPSARHQHCHLQEQLHSCPYPNYSATVLPKLSPCALPSRAGKSDRAVRALEAQLSEVDRCVATFHSQY